MANAEKNIRMSVFKKVLFMVFSIIIIFGLISIVFVYFYSYSQAIEKQKQYIQSKTETYANVLKQNIDDAVALTNSLSKNVVVRDYLTQPSLERGGFESLATVLNSSNISGEYDTVFVMDKNGFEVASTDDSYAGKDFSTLTYFRDLKDGQPDVFVDSFVDASNSLGYYVGSSVVDSHGQVIAFVICRINPDNVSASIEGLSIGNSISTTSILSDKYGVILSSSSKEKVFKALAPLTEDVKRTLLSTSRFNNSEISYLGYVDLLKEVDKGSNVSKTIKSYNTNTLSNKETLTSIVKVGEYPFYLIAELALGSVSRPAGQTALVLSLVILISVCSSVLVAYVSIKRILLPLRSLQDVASQAASGNYTKDIHISSNDEFAVLASSIDGMVRRVRDEKRRLEAQVKKRTEELEKINKYFVGRELRMKELKEKISEYEKSKINKKK